MIRKNIAGQLVLMLLLTLGLFAAGQEDGSESSGEAVQITWFNPLYGSGVLNSFDDIMVIQEVEKRLNIDIEWVHPTDPNAELSIMLASGDYTDIIGSNWSGYPGGIYKAFDDGIVIRLNDLIESDVPNVYALMQQYPMYNKAMLNDNGDILGFRRLELGFIERPYNGFQVRKDWLEIVGMDVPETIEDWHRLLTAFKMQDFDNDGNTDEVPFIGDKGNNFKKFAAAFGVLPTGFSMDPDSGRVVYSPIQDAYREWIALMLKWRDEGLIDVESLLVDGKVMEQEAVSGQGGVWWHFNSRLERWKQAGRELDADWLTVAAPYPIGPAGKPYSTENFDRITHGLHYGISSNNSQLEKTMELMNYLYSSEGSELYNWGIEGKTYSVEDGKKSLMVSFDEKPKYIFLDWGSPRIMDVEASFTTYTPHQRTQTQVWKDGSHYGLHIPADIALSDVEARTMSELYGDITTYTNETVDRILLGVETLDIWDEYVETINKMGIDEVVKIYEDALKRYEAR